MRSTSRRLQEQAASSLDESVYEVLTLSDSMVDGSDDEAQTESIASTDGPTPDDASDFSDGDEGVEYGTDSYHLQHSTASLQAETIEQQHDSHSIHSVGDSTLTEVPTHRFSGGLWHRIRLEEQSDPETGVSSGTKVIRSFPDENGICYPVFDEYGCSEVRVVVKAALSDRSISAPDSYRILYVGMPDKWDEDVITTKITAALTTSPGTSRSIMVQGQLEPYGPIMHVDRCTNVQILSANNEQARITLELDNGLRLAFGQGRRFASAARPDLVIFCHGSAPQSAEEAQNYAITRAVFDREQVPYLELTSVRQYHQGAHSYDSRSLAVCMEGRKNPEADFELKEVLPIDHFTFNDLDPSQVNRHLALISPHMVTVSNNNLRTVQTGDEWKATSRRSWITMPGLAKVLLTVFSAMVMGYFFNPVLMPLLKGTGSSNAVSAAFTPYSELFASPPPMSLSSATVISVPTASIPSTPRGLSVISPQVKPKKEPKKKTEKRVHFEIQSTDDHQFALIPNAEILNARKKPQLQIQVEREAEAVPIRFNRTISGIYVVDIEQQYPFGMFNVTIASYSKPLVQQSFDIALGHNKSMLDHILDSTSWTFGYTQSNFFNISNKATTKLRTSLVGLQRATFHLISAEGEQSGADANARLHSVRQVIRKMGDTAVSLKQAPETAWLGVRKATAPVRRSRSLWKLRMRALWLRCQTEKAAGLSSSKQDGKKSWACSKVEALR